MKPIHQNRVAALPRPDVGRTRPQDRRGMALFVVLLLLSLTVGLSYAAMRSQYTAGTIQRNSNRLREFSGHLHGGRSDARRRRSGSALSRDVALDRLRDRF